MIYLGYCKKCNRLLGYGDNIKAENIVKFYYGQWSDHMKRCWGKDAYSTMSGWRKFEGCYKVFKRINAKKLH